MLLDNTTSLSPQTRAQLLDDSLNLARAGLLSYSVALNMTRYLSKELDLVPWNSVLNQGLSYLDVRFHSQSEDYYNLLQNYLRHLLELVYGTAESEDLVGEKLRFLVMSWSCYLESSTCLDMANALWDSWRFSSDWETEVAPEDKGWAYCNGIRQGGPDDWELALERMGNSLVAGEKMALLEGLACTRNLTLLTAYLDYSISSACKVRTQDKRYLYLAIGRAPGGGNLMLNWLQAKWQQISEFYGDSFVYNVKNMVIGAGEQGSSSEDLLQLQNLLDQHRDELGSSVKAVEQAMDEVEANKLWMEEHFDAVWEWLTEAQSVEVEGMNKM